MQFCQQIYNKRALQTVQVHEGQLQEGLLLVEEHRLSYAY